MKKIFFLILFVALTWGKLPSDAGAIDLGWMQKGVRLWYLGGAGGAGVTSSNAEEAYTIDAITGTSAQVTHHSALDHWQSPLPVDTQTYPLLDKGPCWIHPLALQNLASGDNWMGNEITLVERATYTYETFPYHLLPIKALFDQQAQREIVKLSYMIAGFSVGNAYFDSETGILLYYHTLWGANQMFFILGEINYDFALKSAFAEDDGPHTGFRSDVIEQSLGINWIGGGSVSIQSMVETRYGDIIEMRVLTSILAPQSLPVMADENYCFFGSVPILRRMDAATAPNLPPDQWNPIGQYLWWWLPPSALSSQSINVIDVPMQKTADPLPTFIATDAPLRFFFDTLWFGADGYLTAFAARNPATGLDLTPDDDNFVNLTTVLGLSYYRNTMGRAVPEGEPPPIPPPPVPVTPPPAIVPLIAPLLLF